MSHLSHKSKQYARSFLKKKYWFVFFILRNIILYIVLLYHSFLHDQNKVIYIKSSFFFLSLCFSFFNFLDSQSFFPSMVLLLTQHNHFYPLTPPVIIIINMFINSKLTC